MGCAGQGRPARHVLPRRGSPVQFLSWDAIGTLMKTILAVVGFLLAGCGGAGGPCANRTGTWRQNLTARTGNCAASIENVVTAPQSNEMPAGCAGTASASDDNCSESADITCAPGDGTTARTTGQVAYNSAATSGSGVYELTVRNGSGAVVCHGTYDVTLVKL